jgi:hypothetical protein
MAGRALITGMANGFFMLFLIMLLSQWNFYGNGIILPPEAD